MKKSVRCYQNLVTGYNGEIAIPNPWPLAGLELKSEVFFGYLTRWVLEVFVLF